MMKFREQVGKYHFQVVDDKVDSIDRAVHCFQASTALGDNFQATTVILAVGRERRKLGLQHEEEWTGRGISFCSTYDSPLHCGNVVAVVGRGGAAVKGAVLLGKYAKQVYIVYRGVAFTRPEPANLRLLDECSNVEHLFSTKVIELKGDNGLSGAVTSDQAERGILICGSGVGACIAANKVPGVRACLGHDIYSAHQGVEHDNMNILCLGARVVGIELAKDLVAAFLNAGFTGEERHRRRLNKVAAIERRVLRGSQAQSQGEVA